jgi:hypothetical protein
MCVDSTVNWDGVGKVVYVVGYNSIWGRKR